MTDPHAPAAPSRPGPPLLPVVSAVALGLLVLLLGLPVVGLLARVPPPEILRRAGDPGVLAALRLSLLTTLASTALVAILGLPAAYLLATREFRGKRAVEVMIDLPMVLPPTVAGFALLMAFGRAGLAGGALASIGVSLPFTLPAVIVAQTFMAAPFFVTPARAGIAGVDRRLIDAAATLRASEGATLVRVILPLAWPSIRAGLALAAARALGEFGATITFAGNLPGTTQTMPLAVYVALQSDIDRAFVLAILLLFMSVALLFALRLGPAATVFSLPHARAGRPSPAR